MAYVEAYQREGTNVVVKCDQIVNILSDICSTAPQGSREIAIVTLAAIGRCGLEGRFLLFLLIHLSNLSFPQNCYRRSVRRDYSSIDKTVGSREQSLEESSVHIREQF